MSRNAPPATFDDDHALRVAYREHGAPLYRFALRALGDCGLAEDAVQETFVRAWRARQRYDPAVASTRTWLFAIARNAVIDLARARAARPQTSSLSPDSVSTHNGIETALHAAQVEEALRMIGDDHRRVIVEVHLRGRCCTEVAAELGVPDGTVRSRLFYGLKALRVALDEVGWVDVD